MTLERKSNEQTLKNVPFNEVKRCLHEENYIKHGWSYANHFID